MKELDINETKSIYAGALSPGVYALIAAGVSFLVGVFDGVTRPFKCR